MSLPLVVRLLLDAQDEFVRAVDAVPAEARESSAAGLNTAGWVLAHVAFFHDVWINVDAQGLTPESCEPWLRAWFRRQREAGEQPIEAPFGTARKSFGVVLERTTPHLRSLTDADLESVQAFEEGAWPPGTTVGYLVSRAVAHMFAHAGELTVIATATGGRDIGLPGRMSNARS